jgi:hypothetical protein
MFLFIDRIMDSEIENRIILLESLIIELYITKLREYGYVVIPNVLTDTEVDEAKTLFFKWKNSIPDLDKFHNTADPHGIFKFHQVGHQEHAWFIRTRPKIIEIFKKLWKTEEVVVSFDGCCYIPKNCTKKDKLWTHTDQAPCNKGETCFQGFVALTKNDERTLIVYEKSHLLHEEYFKKKNITDSKNWHIIESEFLNSISENIRKVTVNSGDLVLWDSRTFHQNSYGSPNSEERLVQYVSYLPKFHSKNTKSQNEKRLKYFKELRTTSHWCYPIHVNSLQPQTYGNNDLLIDYEKLKTPDLSNYIDCILKLI